MIGAILGKTKVCGIVLRNIFWLQFLVRGWEFGVDGNLHRLKSEMGDNVRRTCPKNLAAVAQISRPFQTNERNFF